MKETVQARPLTHVVVVATAESTECFLFESGTDAEACIRRILKHAKVPTADEKLLDIEGLCQAYAEHTKVSLLFYFAEGVAPAQPAAKVTGLQRHFGARNGRRIGRWRRLCHQMGGKPGPFARSREETTCPKCVAILSDIARANLEDEAKVLAFCKKNVVPFAKHRKGACKDCDRKGWEFYNGGFYIQRCDCGVFKSDIEAAESACREFGWKILQERSVGVLVNVGELN